MADIDTYPDSGFLDGTEKFPAKRGSGGVRVFSNRMPYLEGTGVMRVPASGVFFGGFGALSTAVGVNDWNDVSNARSGGGLRLMSGSSANRPPNSSFNHPFNFEYASKNGGGNMTQFAIPYQQNNPVCFRVRFGGTWHSWSELLGSDASGHFYPTTNGVANLGGSSRRFNNIYAVNATIQTSDERHKKEIGPIPEEWLDAWGAVEWVRYKRKSGDRWHVGLIAQRIHTAFEVRGLDAFEIGIIGYDEWGDEYASVLDDDGNPVEGKKGELVIKAGDLWSLRYEECLVFEAAYQRRETARNKTEIHELKAIIEAAGLLKSKNTAKES